MKKGQLFLGLILFFCVVVKAQMPPDVNKIQCMFGPEFKISFANVFTPNSDYRNDNFVPEVQNPICIESYEMTIFNRWGQFMYETHVYNKGWAGNDIYGNLAQEGTYFFIVHYRKMQIDDKPSPDVTEKGFFLLAR